MRLIVVFYKGSCGFCHKLINEPIETLPTELKAEGFLFVDAAADHPNHAAFMSGLFDKTRGVPQTYVVDMDVKAKQVGFKPAKDFTQTLVAQMG
jgi:hypothetical protein